MTVEMVCKREGFVLDKEANKDKKVLEYAVLDDDCTGMDYDQRLLMRLDNEEILEMKR